MVDLVGVTLKPVLAALRRTTADDTYLAALRQSVKVLREQYRSGAPDFSSRDARAAYCVAYHPYHAHLALMVLRRFADALEFEGSTLRVVVFGAGPAPELIALGAFLTQTSSGVTRLEVDLVDREQGWVKTRAITVDATLHEVWSGAATVRHHVLDLTSSDGVGRAASLVAKADLVFAQALFTELRMDDEVMSFMDRLMDSFPSQSLLLATDFARMKGFAERLAGLEARPDVRTVRGVGFECPMPRSPAELKVLYTGSDGLIERRRAVVESRLYGRPGLRLKARGDTGEHRVVPDQVLALDRIERFIRRGTPGVFILTGPAGTGKTHIMSRAAERAESLGRYVEMWAATGQAARRLGVRTARSASTVHSALYAAPRRVDRGSDVPPQVRFERRDGGVAGRVVFIDEASLIGNGAAEDLESADLVFEQGRLLDDILTVVTKDQGVVVFVGDRFQLPPYGETEPLALARSFFSERGVVVEEAELSTVNRQDEGSAILRLADACRVAQDRGDDLPGYSALSDAAEVQVLSPGSAPEWLMRELVDGTAMAVTFRHDDAKRWIDRTRSLVGRPVGMPVEGDRLVTIRASHGMGLLNGEELRVVEVGGATLVTIHSESVLLREMALAHVDLGGTVTTFTAWVVDDLLRAAPQVAQRHVLRTLWADFVWRASREGHGRDSPEFFEMLDGDPYMNALWCMYSYARTCQRAQGGEWDHAICDLRGTRSIRNARTRFGYTALTRARRSAWLIDWPTDRVSDDAELFEDFVDVALEVVARHLGPVVAVPQGGGSPYVSLRRAAGDAEVVVNLWKSMRFHVQKPLVGVGRARVEEELREWLASNVPQTFEPPDEAVASVMERLAQHFAEQGYDFDARKSGEHQVLMSLSTGDRVARLRQYHTASGQLTGEIASDTGGDSTLLQVLRNAVELVNVGGET